ncbi:ribosome small subunit-dependent GTPase A [Candidatus Latescibacterota bacterium]
MSNCELEALGWNSFFEKEFASYKEEGFEAGRVAVENRNSYIVYSEFGELAGEASGRMLYSSLHAELPKVGDWVAMAVFPEEKKAIIHHVLPRKTQFSRNAAGKKTSEQVVAANLDIVFIVQGLDFNYNLRRLERYLVMAHESKAQPAAILNKADLCDDWEERASEVRSLASDIPVFAVSAKSGMGVDEIKHLITPGMTVAFIGSSGVGKSTIINRLAGKDILETGEVRDFDSKGRHVTTRRELILLPDGGMLVDTPGMRELQLWTADDGIRETFADIEEMAQDCHFADCTHTVEAKCAVLQAVKDGSLPVKRHENYVKMQKELSYLDTKQDKSQLLEKKRKDKTFGRMVKRMKKTFKKGKY